MINAFPNLAGAKSDIDALLAQPLETKPALGKKRICHACFAEWRDISCDWRRPLFSTTVKTSIDSNGARALIKAKMRRPRVSRCSPLFKQ